MADAPVDSLLDTAACELIDSAVGESLSLRLTDGLAEIGSVTLIDFDVCTNSGILPRGARATVVEAVW